MEKANGGVVVGVAIFTTFFANCGYFSAACCGSHDATACVTAKPEPNDVDVFLVMDELFEVSDFSGAIRLLFDHQSADGHFGASVFWVLRPVEFGGEQAMIEYWQTKRDRTLRGIVEIAKEPS